MRISDWSSDVCSSDLDVRALAGDDGVADRQALRRQDVALLAVRVLDERDEGAAVGIVFQPRDLGRHVELAPLDVDAAVESLVAAAPAPRRDAAEIVSAARPGQAFGQLLDRAARKSVVAGESVAVGG